jgi:hypothetical protein
MLVASMVAVYTRSQSSIMPVKYTLNSTLLILPEHGYELDARISSCVVHRQLS